MTIETRIDLVDLLLKAWRAHYQAFAATEGADPDWSIWYASYLQEPFSQQLNLNFHKSQLIYCLMNTDIEHQARSPDSAWAEFYADRILECYASSESPEDP